MSYRYGIRQWFRWLRNWLQDALPDKLKAMAKKLLTAKPKETPHD